MVLPLSFTHTHDATLDVYLSEEYTHLTTVYSAFEVIVQWCQPLGIVVVKVYIQ